MNAKPEAQTFADPSEPASPGITLRARIDRWDRHALLSVCRLQSRLATRILSALTRLGDPASWAVVCLVLAGSGGEGRKSAALLAEAAIAAVLLSQILKRLWNRPRPSASGLQGFSALVESPDAFSFPSGHTAVAFAIAVALAGTGQGLGALMLTLAPGIAISRVYLGAHYPLDVLAGSLLGTGIGLVVRSLAG